MNFSDFDLAPEVQGVIQGMGWETPTAIQAKSIPAVLDLRDVIGTSQTGSGKTAAFGLGLVSLLHELAPPKRCPRLLILEPTRELASQVADVLTELCANTKLKIGLIYGGVNFDKQAETLKRGVDIVVATPGRLLDHLEKRNLRLFTLRHLVLDEVDRMLDMGFLPDVRKIVSHCPKNRQTLLFSATMPEAIVRLSEFAVKKDRTEITIGRQGLSAATSVSHAFYPVAMTQRNELLDALIQAADFKSLMIFTRTKIEANEVYEKLSNDPANLRVAIMHGDIRQKDREKALRGFRDGSFDIIVATDIAARGLDISGVTHVINYRVPENPEDYIHRIGRTGRASQKGDAFTILSADEAEFAEAIDTKIGTPIERKKLADFPYTYTALLDPQAKAMRQRQEKQKARKRAQQPRKRRR